MAEMIYQRLTRVRNRTMFAFAATARTSLWLGPDHLLCVDTTNYTESYKRFYFRDIQAITVQATKRRAVWNWILGILTALCLALGIFNSLSAGVPLFTGLFEPGTIVSFVGFLIFGIPLLVNNLFGRTCICQLRTAVQTEELASLARVRKARQVLEKIRPLIAAAQGELTAEEISARLRASVRPEIPAPENLPPVLS